jgi:hypothetical protein
VQVLYSPGAAANHKKRGAKGYFSGSRLDLLDQYRDEYISLRGKSRAKFWHKLFDDWWKAYPWRLADDEEPPADDPEKMAELSYVGDDSKQKGEVEQKLREVSHLHFPSPDDRDQRSMCTEGCLVV